LLHKVDSGTLCLSRETVDDRIGAAAGRRTCLRSLLLLLLSLLLGGDLHGALTHDGLLGSLKIGHVSVHAAARRLLGLLCLLIRLYASQNALFSARRRRGFGKEGGVGGADLKPGSDLCELLAELDDFCLGIETSRIVNVRTLADLIEILDPAVQLGQEGDEMLATRLLGWRPLLGL
jgi:hypothetical protein